MNDLLDDNPYPKQRRLTYRYYVLIVWLTVFLIGTLFREMHWPFANLIRVGASAALAAFAITQAFGFGLRHLRNLIALVLSVSWIIWIVTGAAFRGGYPFNWTGVTIFFAFLGGFIIWYGIFLAVRIRKHRRLNN